MPPRGRPQAGGQSTPQPQQQQIGAQPGPGGGQAQVNLTTQQMEALQAHIRSVRERGVDVTPDIIQNWITNNARIAQQQIQLDPHQQQMIAQRQAALQQMQAQQQQFGLQQPPPPPPPGPTAASVHAIVQHLFPPQLAQDSRAALAHLVPLLFPNGAQQPGQAHSGLMQQVMILASNQQLTPDQMNLLKAAVAMTRNGQSNPIQYAQKQLHAQQQHAIQAQQQQLHHQPQQQPPSQQNATQAVQALQQRVHHIEQLLNRPDVSDEQRAKMQSELDAARNNLARVIKLLLAAHQQNGQSNGLPVGTPGAGGGPGVGATLQDAQRLAMAKRAAELQQQANGQYRAGSPAQNFNQQQLQQQRMAAAAAAAATAAGAAGSPPSNVGSPAAGVKSLAAKDANKKLKPQQIVGQQPQQQQPPGLQQLASQQQQAQQQALQHAQAAGMLAHQQQQQAAQNAHAQAQQQHAGGASASIAGSSTAAQHLGPGAGALNPGPGGTLQLSISQVINVPSPVPEPFQPPRPTLSSGLANSTSISTPAITKPPISWAAFGQSTGAGSKEERERKEGNLLSDPLLSSEMMTGVGSVGLAEGKGRVLSKRKMKELVESVDAEERLSEEVEDLLLEITDEFIDSIARFSCQLATHRRGDRLEAKDLALHLDRNYAIKIPGFQPSDEAGPAGVVKPSVSNRRVNPPPTYLARLAAVQAASSLVRPGKKVAV